MNRRMLLIAVGAAAAAAVALGARSAPVQTPQSATIVVYKSPT